MKRPITLIICGLCIAVLAPGGMGQQADSSAPGPAPDNTGPTATVFINIPPPTTKIETLLVRKGIVVVKGFSDIGVVIGEDGSTLGITAIELSTAAEPSKEYGLMLTVRDPRRREPAAIAYIDDDEIDALVDALAAIGKLDNTVTPLTNFQANYRSKGNFEISNTLYNGGRMLDVRGVQILSPSGQIIWADAYFRLSRIAEIRQQLVAAKQALEKIRTPGK